jgi:hypothetical protein
MRILFWKRITYSALRVRWIQCVAGPLPRLTPMRYAHFNLAAADVPSAPAVRRLEEEEWQAVAVLRLNFKSQQWWISPASRVRCMAVNFAKLPESGQARELDCHCNLTFLTATAGSAILAAFVVSICLQHG